MGTALHLPALPSLSGLHWAEAVLLLVPSQGSGTHAHIRPRESTCRETPCVSSTERSRSSPVYPCSCLPAFHAPGGGGGGGAENVNSWRKSGWGQDTVPHLPAVPPPTARTQDDWVPGSASSRQQTALGLISLEGPSSSSIPGPLARLHAERGQWWKAQAWP